MAARRELALALLESDTASPEQVEQALAQLGAPTTVKVASVTHATGEVIADGSEIPVAAAIRIHNHQHHVRRDVRAPARVELRARVRPRERRVRSSCGSRAGPDSDPDEPEPPLGGFSFSEFTQLWPDWPSHVRALAFDTLSPREQQECWDDLADRCRLRNEEEYLYESRLYQEWPPRKRSMPHGTPRNAATGCAHFPDDDPLKRILAAEYLAALAGVDVASSGRTRCPMPDHEDRHPSAYAYGTRWRCFACGAGGSIIDLAAAIYGIEPRGQGYLAIRDRLVADLEGVSNV